MSKKVIKINKLAWKHKSQEFTAIACLHKKKIVEDNLNFSYKKKVRERFA